MRSTCPRLLLIFWGAALLLPGCSHTAEKRVVRAFAESIAEHDLAQLRARTSDSFETRAIRGDETFHALNMLDLPAGRQKVAKVREVKDDQGTVVEERVTVEIGKPKEQKRKVQYRLTRDGAKGPWVVDDVFLSKADEKANKSVASQVSVLNSLRESLAAWESGARDRILSAGTPEFQQALAEVSPAHLQRFAKKVTADLAPQTRVSSQTRIGDETAEMRLPREGGELVLHFRRSESEWKLDDLRVESRRPGEGIESVRAVASALSTALAFQNAYRAGDKRALEAASTREFFQGCLAAADLTLVPLPGASDGQEDFDVQLEGKAATFKVQGEAEVLKISLVRQAHQQLHTAPAYRVQDVTLYELHGSQDKRLSALFTGHAALHAFSAALAARDLSALRASSTTDFNERVWKPMRKEHLASLPSSEVPGAPPRIVQTSFKGSLAEVLVEQGDLPLTYVLREEAGRMRVDDLLLPATARPESLKTNGELLLPVLELAAALDDDRMDAVRGECTDEFSRTTWNHFRETPLFDRDPLPHLRQRLGHVGLGADRAQLTLGDARHGAKVTLAKERGKYRVDDVVLVYGPQEEESISMKSMVRRQLITRRVAR